MLRKACVLLYTSILLTLPELSALSQVKPPSQGPPIVALINGQWFNDKSF